MEEELKKSLIVTTCITDNGDGTFGIIFPEVDLSEYTPTIQGVARMIRELTTSAIKELTEGGKVQ